MKRSKSERYTDRKREQMERQKERGNMRRDRVCVYVCVCVCVLSYSIQWLSASCDPPAALHLSEAFVFPHD